MVNGFAASTWLLTVLLAVPSLGGENPRLFHGYRGCLALDDRPRIAEGDRLLVIAAGSKPVEARVGPISGPVEGTPCWQAYRRELPPRVAALALPDEVGDEPFFAVPTSSDLRIVSGPAVRLPDEDAAKWVRTLSPSLPTPWRAPDLVPHAYRYGPADRGGPTAIELYLGRLERSAGADAQAVASARIRRTFLVDGRALAAHMYERVSGREERADTGPPELTLDNWSTSDTERTVGFVSTDRGRTWTRLSTDVGFEAIWWIAQALERGLPRTSERYLPTAR